MFSTFFPILQFSEFFGIFHYFGLSTPFAPQDGALRTTLNRYLRTGLDILWQLPCREVPPGGPEYTVWKDSLLMYSDRLVHDVFNTTYTEFGQAKTPKTRSSKPCRRRSECGSRSRWMLPSLPRLAPTLGGCFPPAIGSHSRCMLSSLPRLAPALDYT
eukprot:1194705-Prorocentrum_minimum.AAC.3